MFGSGICFIYKKKAQSSVLSTCMLDRFFPLVTTITKFNALNRDVGVLWVLWQPLPCKQHAKSVKKYFLV